MKRGRRCAATVCASLFATLLTASCPEGNAFGLSTGPFARRRTATATTATARRCSATRPAAAAADPAEEIDGARESEIEFYDDDKEGGEEEEFDDDDIHPSVAWLYPAASSPTTDSTGSSNGRAHSRRRKPSRRTLCVDYGTRRVGLAIGVGISPRTVPGVTNRGSDLEVARQVLVRARGEGIRDIVVGLPLERNGTETAMCEIVRGFASVLADVGAQSRPPSGIFLWDERFSSAQAGAMLDPYGGGMSSKVEIDSLAASLILEHFFEEGGTDSAERVEPSTGVVPLEVLMAAGREGDRGRGREGEKEEDAYGEGSRRRFQEMREESARSSAAGEDLVVPRKSARRKRRRR